MLVTPEQLKAYKEYKAHHPQFRELENLKLNIAPEILEAAKRDRLAHLTTQQYKLQELNTHVHLAANYCEPGSGAIDINVDKGGKVVINKGKCHFTVVGSLLI